MRSRPRTAAMWLTLLVLAGCATPDTGGGPIRTLYMVTTPVALNLDEHPGVDGIGVNLFAFGTGAKAIRLPPGTVEFTAYDSAGILANPARPFHVWTFGVGELMNRETTAAIGEGYKLLLDWSPKLLLTTRLAVVCRYRPEEGPEVVSKPGVIAASDPAVR